VPEHFAAEYPESESSGPEYLAPEDLSLAGLRAEAWERLVLERLGSVSSTQEHLGSAKHLGLASLAPGYLSLALGHLGSVSLVLERAMAEDSVWVEATVGDSEVEHLQAEKLQPQVSSDTFRSGTAGDQHQSALGCTRYNLHPKPFGNHPPWRWPSML
jgi:hypothetical protein